MYFRTTHYYSVLSEIGIVRYSGLVLRFVPINKTANINVKKLCISRKFK